MNQQVTLPPIKHVFQGLLNSKSTDSLHPNAEKHHHRRSSVGMDSAVEAARSLQQLSSVSAGAPCFHCSPAPAASSSSSSYSCCATSHHNHQQQHPVHTRLAISFGGHRRTVSASVEAPYHRHHPQHHVSYSLPSPPATAAAAAMPDTCSPYSRHPHPHSHYQHRYHAPYAHPHPQQQHPPAHYVPRRARAHTTSGYPPTMLYPMHANQQTSAAHKTTNEMQTSFSPPSSSSSASTSATTTPAKNSSTVNHRYHCHHCRKSFSRPSSLRIHIYSHTGEKPFKCHYQGCGRSFSVHSNMRRHLRVHYYPQQQQQQAGTSAHMNSSMRLPLVPSSRSAGYSDEEEEEHGKAEEREEHGHKQHLMLMRQQTMCYTNV